MVFAISDPSLSTRIDTFLIRSNWLKLVAHIPTWEFIEEHINLFIRDLLLGGKFAPLKSISAFEPVETAFLNRVLTKQPKFVAV